MTNISGMDEVQDWGRKHLDQIQDYTLVSREGRIHL